MMKRTVSRTLFSVCQQQSKDCDAFTNYKTRYC